MAVENGRNGLGGRVGWLSLPAGFINGVWVILAGTSYFGLLSPYHWLMNQFDRLGAAADFFNRVESFLFKSGFQFVLAPLLGVLLGLLLGRLATRKEERAENAIVRITGAVMGGLGGALSISIVFLNVYAS